MTLRTGSRRLGGEVWRHVTPRRQGIQRVLAELKMEPADGIHDAPVF